MRTETLRSRQTELTRDEIMRALAEHVAETNSIEFSVQEIADRAGVSHRTVYRHYPTREALAEALAAWIDERMGASASPVSPTTVDELPDAIRTNHARFDELAPMTEALVRLRIGAGIGRGLQPARVKAFRRAVKRSFPALCTEDIRIVAGVLHNIASVQSWFSLRHEIGLSPSEAVAASVWATCVLLDAVGDGDVPTRHEEGT